MLRVEEDDLEWDENNLPSYQGEPFTGESVETLPNGQLISLTTYVDGLDDGPFRTWSKDGVLLSEGTSRRGRAVGVSRQWYDSGAPKVECEFDGQGDVLWYRSWDEDGKVTEEYGTARKE